jgi:hypothetical protein
MTRSQWLLCLRRWLSAPCPLTPRGRRVRPELELLEQRTLLSGNIPLTPGAWTSIGPAPIQTGEVGLGGSSAASGSSGYGNGNSDQSVFYQGAYLGSVAAPTSGYGQAPVSGRVTGLATDPTNANHILAATAGGGIWQTTDGGTTWAPITDNLNDANGNPVDLFTSAVAFAPSNPKVIYAGTGEVNNSIDGGRGVGLVASTDGGQTWTLVTGNASKNEFVGENTSKIVFDPGNSQIVYVAVSASSVGGGNGNAGIWKSNDGGKTWVNTTFTNGGTSDQWSDLVIDPTTSGDNAVLYAAVGDAGGPFAGPHNGVFQSSNGGRNWAFLPNSTQNQTPGRIALALSHPVGSANPTVYALAANVFVPINGGPSNTQGTLAFIEQSTDNGQTWQNPGTAPFQLLSNQGWYDISIAVDPTNPSLVYAGGADGVKSLIESTTGGMSWTDISQGSPGSFGPHPNTHALAVDANGNLVAGTDGGVFKLTSGTPGNIAWQDINGNLGTGQFNSVALDATNEDVAYATAQGNGTDKFTGGLNWTQGLGGNGGTVLVDPTTTGGSQVVYTTHFYNAADPGGNPFFLRSSDGGQTWSTAVSGIQSTTDPAQFYVPVVMDPENPSRLLLGTDQVYETTTGATPDPRHNGNDWHFLGQPLPTGNVPITAMAIDPADPNTILVTVPHGGANDSTVFLTTDDGFVWQDVTPQANVAGGDNYDSVAFDPNDPSILYESRANEILGAPVRGQIDSVFQSKDGGKTWSDITGTLPAQPRSLIVLPGHSTVYVGTDLGVYYTNGNTVNGNVQWTRFDTGLPSVPVKQLAFANINGDPVLAAATYGRGIWETLVETLLTVTVTPTPAVEAQQLNAVTVATFTDPVAPGPQASTFTATILWGDSSQSPGTVQASGSGYSVQGSHVYAEEGNYSVQVLVHGPEPSGGLGSGTEAVADAPLAMASVNSPSATVGTSTGNVVVGSFSDGNPEGTASDFTATVSWGDGSTSTLSAANGGIVADGGSVFSVTGSHTYANAANTLPFAVSVADVGSATTSGTGLVTVQQAATQMSLNGASATFNRAAQTVTLQANVTSLGNPVAEGAVTFTVGNLAPVTGTVNASGQASATLAVPAGFAPGNYSYSASYADTNNAYGIPNYLPTSAQSVFTINPAPTAVAVAQATAGYNPSVSQNETLSANVTSTGGTVNEGSVTFTVGALSTTAAVNSAGLASTSLTLPAGFLGGTYAITASYADTANANGFPLFANGTGTGTLTISPATTQTTLTSTSLSAGFNSSASQSITLTANATGAFGPLNEGNVTFTVASLSVQGAVSNGTATANLTLPAGLAAGSYTIGASYADAVNSQGGVNYATSTSAATGTLTVATAPTSTAVNNVTAGYSTASQQVSLLAMVTSSTGGRVNEGSVTFTVGSLPSVSAAVSAGGQASALITLPAGFALGNYAVNASYSDSLNSNNTVDFAANMAGPAQLTSQPAPTSVQVGAVNAIFNSATQTLTLSATVTSPGGGSVNEGSVSFAVGSLSPVSGKVNSQGQASVGFVLPAGFAAGNYTITANYGDAQGNFDSVSGTGTLSLASAASQTGVAAVQATFNSASQLVTVTATMSSPNGGTVNEGSVTFSMPGLSSVTGQVDKTGTATAQLSLPAGFAAGSYTVSANYSDGLNANGIVNFTASNTTAALNVGTASSQLNVGKVTTTFSPTASQQVTLTANVSSPNGGNVNEGTVSFTVGNLPSVQGVVSNGQASTLLTLPIGFTAGSYTINASYNDGLNANNLANYAASTGTGTLTVQPLGTLTNLTPATVTTSYNPSSGSLMVSAQVTSSAGPVTEGTVAFTVGRLAAVKAGLNSAGVASAVIPLPGGFAAGQYPITASYTDTATPNYGSSTSSGGTLTVQSLATSTTASNVSVTFNSATQQATLSATVTGSGGAAVNEGQVTFTVANLTATAVVYKGNATATVALPAGLAAGSYAVNASYTDVTNTNGVTNFNGSSGPATLSVSTVATNVSVNSISVVLYGPAQQATLTATVSAANGTSVNEGFVTFTAAGQTITTAVQGGLANAVLTIPGGSAPGTSAISASYADVTNANGLLNFTASAGSGALTVQQSTTVTITHVSIAPGFGSVSEAVTAQVTSPFGPVNGGVVTFNVAGTLVQAGVVNGTASAQVRVPASAAGGSQGIGAAFSEVGGAFAASSGSRSVFLNFLSEFFPTVVSIAADGSEVVSISFFGIPLVFTYNADGVLVALTFGFMPL